MSYSMKCTRTHNSHRILLATALVAMFACAAHPGSAYYIDPSQADLNRILAPPSASDSDEGRADLEAVLAVQRSRTEGEVKSAQADSEESLFRFTDVMETEFKSENLPFTMTFFSNVYSDYHQAVASAKSYFNRPRPFVADPDVKPVIKLPQDASYPSGHATFAYVNAILLAYMVPEKAAAIFERAAIFARNRVVAGVHYPTDVEAGRISGSVIDNVFLDDPRFMADFEKARAEVRHALGLP